MKKTKNCKILPPHPYLGELKDQFQTGKVSRRDFLRQATLLGMSAVAATTFSSAMFPFPAYATSTAQPKRGGTFKFAVKIKGVDDPARLSWVDGSNIVRLVSEHLTVTDSENVTHPQLLERWAASEDLKTWDLYLRKGIKFNNGDEMTAADVMFTFKHWLTKSNGSSMFGLLSYIGGFQNVEKVNPYQIRLHLEKPNIAVPEHLFHYPGMLLHRDFDGDFLKKPIGTGPFILSEFVEGERCIMTARKDYWRKGLDGLPLPYIDRVMFLDMDKDAAIAALCTQQIDAIMTPRPSDYLTAKNIPGLVTYPVKTANTFVVKMRIDTAPWDDNRVRTAMKMCQDRKKLLRLAAFNEGVVGIDAHVAPVHPEWCPKPTPKYDPEGALKLLKEYAKEKDLQLPLKVTLSTKNNLDEPSIAQGLKEMALPGGFDIQLDITEPGGYWSRWTEVSFGITSWSHRPLGTMILPLAYTKESIGAWNETRWHDEEFTKYLREAEATLDVNQRREIMCKLEDIMQERGPIGISYYSHRWEILLEKWKNVKAHPSQYTEYIKEMWMDS